MPDLTFHDPRAQALWDHSDLRTLWYITEVVPHGIVSPDEWQAVLTRHGHLFSEGGRVAWEASTGTPVVDIDVDWRSSVHVSRWVIARHALLRIVENPFEPCRLLDIGAWAGAHAIDLANHLPGATIYARNTSLPVATDGRMAIQVMAERHLCGDVWSAHGRRAGAGTVIAEYGVSHAVPLPTALDAIWAGEILEHIWEWEAFLAILEAALMPGGLLVFSVPHGPWERGHVERAHVAHWEPEDLDDVFGACAAYRRTTGTESLTTSVVQCRVGQGTRRSLNWGRKLARWGIG